MSRIATGSLPTPVWSARSGAASAVWLAVLLVGGLLAFAGVMKIATGMPAQIAQGALELAIVGVMVWRRRSWLVWLGAACMFGAFAGWTAFLAWWGSSSCGCFGSLSVPPRVTLLLDLGAMTIALATSAAQMRSAAAGLAPAITAVAVFTIVGAGVSSALANPRPEDFGDDATALLLTSEAYGELGRPGPTWYIYLYEPACPVCQRHLPEMRGLEATTADDPAFRVRALSIHEVEKATGVPSWAWGTPPATLVVRDGQVLERASAVYVSPRDAAARHAPSAAAPTDPIDALVASPEFARLDAGAPGEPALLLYLFDEACAACGERAASIRALRATMPDDPIMRTASMRMQAMTSVAPGAWGAEEVAIVVRDGEILRRYAPEEIPDPMQVWIALSSGLLLD